MYQQNDTRVDESRQIRFGFTEIAESADVSGLSHGDVAVHSSACSCLMGLQRAVVHSARLVRALCPHIHSIAKSFPSNTSFSIPPLSPCN
jgi:hypothetical protein